MLQVPLTPRASPWDGLCDYVIVSPQDELADMEAEARSRAQAEDPGPTAAQVEPAAAEDMAAATGAPRPQPPPPPPSESPSRGLHPLAGSHLALCGPRSAQSLAPEVPHPRAGTRSVRRGPPKRRGSAAPPPGSAALPGCCGAAPGGGGFPWRRRACGRPSLARPAPPTSRLCLQKAVLRSSGRTGWSPGQLEGWRGFWKVRLFKILALIH